MAMARLCAGALMMVVAMPHALPAPVSAGTPSVAVQALRRHMLDAATNTLTFHTMDLIFDIREVPRSGPVWVLPRRDTELDFTYDFEGHSHPATDILQDNFTNALLIIKHGHIVYEKYQNNTNAGTRFISFSMAKSFLSMMIGLAVNDGSIHSLDDPLVAYIPELKGSGYDGVTIRQTLQMRSGVGFEERYDFGTHPSQAQQVFEDAIVQNKVRFADMAPHLANARPPGGPFNYSTMDTAVLGWMLERAIKRPIAGYMSEHLWQPLGMESDGFYIADGPPGVGRELSGMGYNATLRDYGRLGLMMLNGGRGGPAGAQILPAEWVRTATASKDIGAAGPPGAVMLGYGYQWWTFAGTRAYLALGLQGQSIFIDPATDTVVVKLSYFPPGDNKADGETFAFLQAVSHWEPK